MERGRETTREGRVPGCGCPTPRGFPPQARCARPTPSRFPPTIPHSGRPPGTDELEPFRLRDAVLPGGSLVAGALLAPLSGDATWINKTAPPPVHHVQSEVPKAIPITKLPPVTKAEAVAEPEAAPAPELPAGGLKLAPPASLKKDL